MAGKERWAKLGFDQVGKHRHEFRSGVKDPEEIVAIVDNKECRGLGGVDEIWDLAGAQWDKGWDGGLGRDLKFGGVGKG